MERLGNFNVPEDDPHASSEPAGALADYPTTDIVREILGDSATGTPTSIESTNGVNAQGVKSADAQPSSHNHHCTD